MSRSYGHVRELLSANGTTRACALMFAMSGVLWVGHCALIGGVGIVILSSQFGLATGPALFFAYLFATLAGIGAAVPFGLAVFRFSGGAFDLVQWNAPSWSGQYPGQRLSRRAYSAATFAAFLCLIYVALGGVALVLPFLLPVDFSTFALVYLLLDLWLVASVVLAGVAIYSGRFLQRMLPLIGMQEEPTFLIQVFAGLCVFSALALIGSLFFVSGGLLVALAVFPFVVTPLVGVFAFGRVFKLGTRLDRLQHPVQPLIPSL